MARLNFSNLNKLVKSSQEGSIPISECFLTELQKSIEKTQQNGQTLPTKAYKPSSMNCVRMMYFYMSGTNLVDEPQSCELIGICESGTDRHERIQQAVIDMKENGFDCEYLDVETYIKENNIPDIEIISKNGYETKLFHKKLNLRYMCDGVIRYKGEYYILEIKTESSFKFNNRTDVDASHHTQACTYSYTLKIPQVLFLYENRDTCQKKAYVYKPTQETINELVLDKIEQCELHLEEHRVPPIPKDISAKTCRYCNYKTICEGSK